MPVSVDVASEWSLGHARVDSRTLVVGVSQSGETADTIGALRLARARGARTVAVTNAPASQMAREASSVLVTKAGIEHSVAATKTFTAQVALLSLLALRLATQRHAISATVRDAVLSELSGVAEAVEAQIGQPPAVEAAAAILAMSRFAMFVGRDAGFPAALEAALKLREVARIPSEVYPAGEMKHGPIALIREGTPVVALSLSGRTKVKMGSSIEELHARGARIIMVSDAEDDDARLAEVVLRVPSTTSFSPIVTAVPLQLLALRTAEMLGRNVDRPPNLAKTVTVE